jgi:hypothetical protein
MVAEMGPESEHHHHHHHTGHRWLDIVLAVSAFVISLISLFLAIQHGRVMERMVEASTWPYVMVGISTANSDGTPHVSLWITNKGVGPARIDSLEVFYGGVAQTDPQSLLKAILKPSDPKRHLPLLQSSVVNSVLSAKETISFVDLVAKDFDPSEYSRVASEVEKLKFRACYCSVFDECTVIDDTRGALRPTPVKLCGMPKTPFLP